MYGRSLTGNIFHRNGGMGIKYCAQKYRKKLIPRVQEWNRSSEGRKALKRNRSKATLKRKTAEGLSGMVGGHETDRLREKKEKKNVKLRFRVC